MDSETDLLLKEPLNFSWVDPEKLAAMGFPGTAGNLQFISEQNIKHLITLSPERVPPINSKLNFLWTLIPIEEFEAPTLSQIQQFIQICEEHRSKNEAIGIHCRQGKGRTGVMAACYLVYFQNLSPQRAITNIRLLRPCSVETYDQEKIIVAYHDYLRRINEL